MSCAVGTTMIYPQQPGLPLQPSSSTMPMMSPVLGDHQATPCGLPRQPPSSATAALNNNNNNNMLMVGKDVGGMSAQSQPPPPGADGLVDDGELRLEVTCGQNQAVLYTGRLQLGSKGTCVFFENAWLTPNEFQYVSGRETAKDWKRSIKHHGKSLKVLIAKGILSTTPPARCDCGQCGNSSTPTKQLDASGMYTSPLVDGVDRLKHSGPPTDCSLPSSDGAWRPLQQSSSQPLLDCAAAGQPTGTGSAFRPPPSDAAAQQAYGLTSPSVYGCSSQQSEPCAYGVGNQQALKSTMAAAIPDGAKKSTTVGFSGNGSSSLKRPRSPSVGSVDHASPSKHHQSSSSASSSSSSSSAGRDCSYNDRQAFSSPSSCRSRDQQQQQQSNGFKSPSHHQQHKGSPTSGVAASSVDPPTSSCGVLSPLAATPYFPFLAAAAAATTTASAVCYPNPYMMLPLAAAAAAYQTPAAAAAAAAAQFPPPYGSWNSSSTSSASAGTSSTAALIGGVDNQSRLAASSLNGASSGAAAFDFPWMRAAAATNYSSKLGVTPPPPSSSSSSTSGPPAPAYDPYEQLAKQSSATAAAFGGFGTQNPYAAAAAYRAPGTGGFGGMFTDGLEAAYDNYFRSKMQSAAAAGFQQSLFESQQAAAAAAAGFGVYPPLFQSPYFGIPSR